MRFFIALAVCVAGSTTVMARSNPWAVALGVQCSYCHVDNAWTDASKPNYDFAKRMSNMVKGLNAGPLKEFEPITCWTCHRGQSRPKRLPVAEWQKIQAEHVGDFTTPERSLAMSVYSASLGVECTHCHETGSFSAPTHALDDMLLKLLWHIAQCGAKLLSGIDRR